MPITAEILRKHRHNDVFVETGCLRGDGIEAALQAGFKTIISIEINQHWIDHCSARFRTYPAVTLVNGDSAEVLWPVIQRINEPITFWLDGHWSSMASTPIVGQYRSPLMQELEAIGRHPVKQHTILIDDMRCWQEQRNQFHEDFDAADIMQAIRAIYHGNCDVRRIDGYDQSTKQVYLQDILAVKSICSTEVI